MQYILSSVVMSEYTPLFIVSSPNLVYSNILLQNYVPVKAFKKLAFMQYLMICIHGPYPRKVSTAELFIL
jgi:hypothetical protein